MPLPSQRELPGSPVEQLSTETIQYYWSPAAAVSSGSTFSSPTVHVSQYDPFYPYDVKDVTSTVCSGGAFMGSGSYAAEVGVTIAALVAGYEYRVVLGCASSDGNQPGEFFRIRCQL